MTHPSGRRAVAWLVLIAMTMVGEAASYGALLALHQQILHTPQVESGGAIRLFQAAATFQSPSQLPDDALTSIFRLFWTLAGILVTVIFGVLYFVV